MAGKPAPRQYTATMAAGISGMWRRRCPTWQAGHLAAQTKGRVGTTGSGSDRVKRRHGLGHKEGRTDVMSQSAVHIAGARLPRILFAALCFIGDGCFPLSSMSEIKSTFMDSRPTCREAKRRSTSLSIFLFLIICDSQEIGALLTLGTSF